MVQIDMVSFDSNSTRNSRAAVVTASDSDRVALGAALQDPNSLSERTRSDETGVTWQ
jgi:hypothetical protein